MLNDNTLNHLYTYSHTNYVDTHWICQIICKAHLIALYNKLIHKILLQLHFYLFELCICEYAAYMYLLLLYVLVIVFSHNINTGSMILQGFFQAISPLWKSDIFPFSQHKFPHFQWWGTKFVNLINTNIILYTIDVNERKKIQTFYFDCV